MRTDITLTALETNDIATIAQIHKSQSNVGLHRFLTLPFLMHYYQTMIEMDAIDTVVVKDYQGNIAGFGYISYKNDFFLRLLRKRPAKLLIHFAVSIGIALVDLNAWPEVYYRVRRLLRFTLTERTAYTADFHGSAEMGFVLVNKVTSLPRQKISPLIFNYLCKQAKSKNYSDVISRVSKGHSASILMHRINSFQLIKESPAEIIFKRALM